MFYMLHILSILCKITISPRKLIQQCKSIDSNEQTIQLDKIFIWIICLHAIAKIMTLLPNAKNLMIEIYFLFIMDTRRCSIYRQLSTM